MIIERMDDIYDPWYRAIHDGTGCLRDQDAEGADMCLAYLNRLEIELLNSSGTEIAQHHDDLDDVWNSIPEHIPSIDWHRFVQQQEQEEMTTRLFPTNHNSSSWMAHPPPPSSSAASLPRLNRRRILARILTSQSEVYAMKATFIVRKEKDWRLAIASYENSISHIRRGLEVTDIAISQWWNRMELLLLESCSGNDNNNSERTRLEEDASIIIVALESITDRRQKLLADGKKEESRLVRALAPQWETRDDAKKRYGENRWTNNPRPKNDYARLRKEKEIRLREVRRALESLQTLDPQTFLQQANTLQQQLMDGTKPIITDLNHNERRYNGLRPLPEYWQKRVSEADYPDPESLGWTFTGSWKEVEFFEQMFPADNMGKVKLDWYFTTATVKTSLDHPIQGKTQLFAKSCHPTEYLEVLINPRTHTGNRYHRKP